MDAHPDRDEGWAGSLALFALAIAGHIAALSLIDAPPYAVYQHFWRLHALMASPPIGVAVLLIQTIVCIWLAFRTWRQLWLCLGRLAPWWCLVGTAALVLFSAAIPTETVRRFGEELVLSCSVMAVAGLNLVFAVRAMPAAPLSRLRSRLSRNLTMSGDDRDTVWDRRLPGLSAAWVLIVSGGLAYFVFDRVPHIDDSVCYLFQAKYLSTGALWLPRPPDPASFGVAHLIVDGGKWYGKFFPGWPAMLALGVLATVPWLVNPLLAAASILLTHRLLRSIYGLRTAHAVTLLLAGSPWLLFLSASLMAHTASLFWALLALVAIQNQRGGRPVGWGLVAGASLGMLFLTRPFDAALLGPVAALWALGLGARRLPFVGLFTTGAAAAGLAGLYFWYNAALTGDPFLAPHRLWADHLFGPGVDVFGFGPNVGIPMWRNQDPLPGHGLADVVLNANKNFFQINVELFGWACGSAVLAGLALQPSALQRRDRLMLGIVLAVIAGHAYYWAPGGPDFGARYWYMMIVPLILLTVRGADMAIARLSRDRGDGDVVAARVVAFVALATASALVVVVPWQSVTKYHHYRGIGREFEEVVERAGITDALVFVRSPRRSDYQAAFTFNPPTLEGQGNVFAVQREDDRAAAVAQHFGGRPVWIVGRETEASAIAVLGGPYPPGTKPPGSALAPDESLQAIIR